MALNMNMGGLGAMMGEDAMEGALGRGTGITPRPGFEIPVTLGQNAFTGQDTMEGALGGGTGITPPPGFEIQVNRPAPQATPPTAGGLNQAQDPFAALSKARQDALQATQDMIKALEQRMGNQGYDVSRLLFAFGQPTSTGSIGSALANLGAEASRQRSEQEKMVPSMMKMRTDLANMRVQEAQNAARAALASGQLPGANVQAAPGTGAAREAAAGTGGSGLTGFFALPLDQANKLAYSQLGPDAAKDLMDQWYAANKFTREGTRVVGNALFNPDGTFTQNPATLAEVKEFPINLGNFQGNVQMTVGDYLGFRRALETGGQTEAAKYLVRLIPSIGERIGAIASPTEVAGSPVQSSAPPVQAPAQAPVQAPAQALPGVAAQPSAQPRQYESESEKKERLEREKEERQQAAKIAEKQAGEDISMLGAEVKDARAPILTRYDKADAVLQEAKQMMQLASTYPYAVGIFAKPGGQYALGQFIKEGIRAGGVNVQIGDFEGAMRRLVRANPEMVARVAKERGISTSQAENYLQQQGLDAASLLLQSERRLDALLNKAERKGEGQVSNYERVLFAQLLPSLSNDPIKAYLFKTIALQEQAKFDKQVGDLLRRRSESKQYDPRKMYDSKEYIQIRTNYVNALEGSMREFFPEMKGRLAAARKSVGV